MDAVAAQRELDAVREHYRLTAAETERAEFARTSGMTHEEVYARVAAMLASAVAQFTAPEEGTE